MNRLVIWLLLIYFGLSACNREKAYVPQDLRKLSHDEIIEKARNYEIPDYSIVYRNQNGLVISVDSLFRQYSPELMFADTYVNNHNELVEVVVRDDIEVASSLLVRLKEAFDLGPEIKPATVDCSKLDNILYNLEQSDQVQRRYGKRTNRKQDLENLAIGMGIIENCGMPMSEQLNGYTHPGLWLVFQHAPHRYRKAYFPYFQEAAAKGLMPKRNVAMMQDRLLLHEGKPQLYGSQVTKGPGGFELLELEAPEFVDQRRLAMGMGTLQDYLNNYGIVFDIPQKQK